MEQVNPNVTLASFLLLHGACDASIAKELSEVCRNKWLPLGAILRRDAGLKMKDVARILSAQADEPTVLFGDMAVRLGICKREEIEAARVAQAEECPHVIDLALADPRVDQERVMNALREYLRYTERVLDQLAQSFPPLQCELLHGQISTGA
ncbi:MAG: hypothetical protein GC161_15105 [Planctomycetaceae bacterium]|nr:hypothetical protein [Planctomycetaceae bacterium]